ncbi:hypothetical protein [Streptomyces triticirhizae]|uniref:Uncharacterized protein n=1 Tax=Streptomyces triticirhizae TaxID=2483353 RepID=A0A3M2LKH5_9ACTN|nr:hypothetical protein [Streptomyces triticirhizae]RMI37982.1 hypothetical protein EBN88_17815 [Streptomyces triticirhizae]
MTVRVGRSVAVGMAVGVGALVVGFAAFVVLYVWATDGPTPVSGEAREEVVGPAEVVHSVETSNATGADGYEIAFLVLDPPGEGLGSPGAEEAERARLAGLGWEFAPDAPSADDGWPVWAFTPRHNASVELQPLPEFLASGSSVLPEDEFRDIEERFAERDDLVVARLRPHRP